MNNLPYNPEDPLDIERYAENLIGHTFKDILDPTSDLYYYSDVSDSLMTVIEDEDTYDVDSYSNKSRKGGLGNLVENFYFDLGINSFQRPDFEEAGVELKVTPYKRLKNGEKRAGERLVLSMISFDSPVEDDFYESHVWEKCKLMLIIYYFRDRSLDSNLDYRIDYVKLYTPPEANRLIIENDYKKIISKIKQGKAHELSEGDTMYLGACTKGSTAKKSWVPQYYNPNQLAKKRAFSLKNSYMNIVLNEYIASDKILYEKVIKDDEVLENATFEEYLESLINKNVGKSVRQLAEEYGIDNTKSKGLYFDLSLAMLGIKSNRAEELEKANITIKAVRINDRGKMVESSSLPQFCFMDLVKEEWEDSILLEYLETSKFFFVVFKKTGDQYYLKGSKLWNMPQEDIEIARQGWENIRQTIIDGVILTPVKTKRGYVVRNNLPKKSDNKVIHIRPHAKKSYYILKDGSTYGSGNIKDADLLPDGRYMTKQSFWINNNYLEEVLRDLIER